MGGCEFLFGMPTPTLLECFDEYIPNHIFKNLILDPSDLKYDNCCIIFDGVGCPACFKFSKDDERHESLGECIMYLNTGENISLYNMLGMKVWFGYCHIVTEDSHKIYDFGILEPYTKEEQKLIIRNHLYDNYVNVCSKCDIAKYCDSFTCYECSLSYCLACFTEDAKAEIRIINEIPHFYCHNTQYPCKGTYKCWKHYVNI